MREDAGIAPALGALLVVAWPGAIVLIAGLVLGRFVHQTGLGSFVALVLLTPVTAFTYGGVGALAGICVVVPMFVKRMLGNRPPVRRDAHSYVQRLLFDRDGTDDREGPAVESEGRA